MTPPFLTKMPDEILLNVFSNLRHHGKYDSSDLASIARAHLRFVDVAREALLEGPDLRVALSKTDSLVATLLKYPKGAKNITSLEVTTPLNGDAVALAHLEPQRTPQTSQNYIEFVKQCQEVVMSTSFCNFSDETRTKWRVRLLCNNATAFFSVLLVLLPNLNTLLCGDGNIRYYPMFIDMICMDKMEFFHKFESKKLLLAASKNPQMLDIAQALRPKLIKLELPFEWKTKGGSLIAAKPGLSFLDYTALRSITLPVSVSGRTAWKPFPRSLQLLRVVVDDYPHDMHSTVHRMIHRQTGRPRHNPNLEYVHVHCAPPGQETSESRKCRRAGPTQIMVHKHPMISPQQIRQVYGPMS